MVFSPLGRHHSDYRSHRPASAGPLDVDTWDHSSAHSPDYHPADAMLPDPRPRAHHPVDGEDQAAYSGAHQSLASGHITTKKRNSSHLSLEDSLVKKSPDLSGDTDRHVYCRRHHDRCQCSPHCVLTNRRRYELAEVLSEDEAGPSASSWSVLMPEETASNESESYLDVVSSVSPAASETPSNYYMDFMHPMTPGEHPGALADGAQPLTPPVDTDMPGYGSPGVSSHHQAHDDSYHSSRMSSLMQAEDLSLREPPPREPLREPLQREPLREEREVVREAYLIEDHTLREQVMGEQRGDQYHEMPSDSDSDVEVVRVVEGRRYL